MKSGVVLWVGCLFAAVSVAEARDYPVKLGISPQRSLYAVRTEAEVRVVAEEDLFDALVTGEVDVVVSTLGALAAARRRYPNLVFVYPSGVTHTTYMLQANRGKRSFAEFRMLQPTEAEGMREVLKQFSTIVTGNEDAFSFAVALSRSYADAAIEAVSREQPLPLGEGEVLLTRVSDPNLVVLRDNMPKQGLIGFVSSKRTAVEKRNQLLGLIRANFSVLEGAAASGDDLLTSPEAVAERVLSERGDAYWKSIWDQAAGSEADGKFEAPPDAGSSFIAADIHAELMQAK